MLLSPKYKIVKKGFSAVIILLFFLLPGPLHAQQDPPPPADTLHEYVDTVTTVVEAAPDEEDTDVTVDTESSGDVHFLPVWSTNAASDSFHHRDVSDSAKAAMAKDDDFWYANMVFKKKEEPNTGKNSDTIPLFETSGFQAFLWIIVIAGFITFLGIYLTNNNVRLFRSSKTIATADDDIETDDIFAINYQKEIDKAVAANNYRLAIRLMFLRLLRNLSDKRLISYAHDKTNFDYLVQVTQARWYQQFFRITRSYEYVWYGLFDIDNEKFDMIKNEFADLEKQL